VAFDYNVGLTVSSVSDTQGNVFTPVGSPLTSPGGGLSRVYYAKNIAGGADTVKVTLSASSSYLELYLNEYSGIDPINPIDAQAGASGNAGAVSSGNATTTVAGDMIYGFCMGDLACTVGSGFAARSTLNGNLVEDEIAGSPGSYAATGTANSGWTMQMVALKPASTSGVATVTLGNLTQTYTGSALTPTATTTPSGLAITWAGAPDTNAGSYPVTATVNNPNYQGSASGTFTINKATATVTLSNLTQTYTGSALTPTATTTPSGLSITWSGAPDTNAGSYSVTATVNNPNYQGSASGTFTVNKATATVTLGNLTQTYTGSSLTPTANTSPGGLAVNWTGAPDTNVGSYAVTATVNDPNYTGSASGTFVINGGSSSTSLASSPNPTTYGTAVTFTATVTPNSATGTVTFYNGSTSLGTATLNNGTAVYTTSTLPAGSNSITASYAGNGAYSGSTSSPLTQTVNPAVLLTSSLNPADYRRLVTFTATVEVGSGATPTGTVTFYNGSSSLGTVTLGGANATLSSVLLPTGSYSITAVYSGDSNYVASTSAVLTQVVNAPTAPLPPNCSP
jgi:hypothetical protein